MRTKIIAYTVISLAVAGAAGCKGEYVSLGKDEVRTCDGGPCRPGEEPRTDGGKRSPPQGSPDAEPPPPQGSLDAALPLDAGRPQPPGAGACTAAECGGRPRIESLPCGDGTSSGVVNCTRKPDGACSWNIRTCPPPGVSAECTENADCQLYEGCPGCECQAHAAGGPPPECIADQVGPCGLRYEDGGQAGCWESEARCVEGTCRACVQEDFCYPRAHQVPPVPPLPADGSCSDDRHCQLYEGCPGCECQAHVEGSAAPACIGDQTSACFLSHPDGGQAGCWESAPRCVEGTCRACVGDFCHPLAAP